ncbi:MAG TPA: ATP-binding protein [Armatimonadota bacterium]|nr:ATP-binding protein [Armatimonadota bacterium]
MRILEDFSVPAEIERVVEVRNRIADRAREVGFRDEAVEEIRLAIGEAFVNAVHHGSRCTKAGQDGRRKPLVSVKLLTTPQNLVIEVRDSGGGFSPEELPPPDDLRPNGRGVYFMRLAMDEVTFEFKKGTLVRMTKHLDGASKARESS